MYDNYDHADDQLIYVPENILQHNDRSVEYMRLEEEYNSLNEHCQCKNICTQVTCKCIQRSGGYNYEAYQKDGKTKYKLISKSESYPVVECSNDCSCAVELQSVCGNRIVHLGPIEGLDIRSCNKGFGLFTRSFISSGTFVCEYAGEILTATEASKRHVINKREGKMNYIMCLREYSGSSTIVTIIDPSTFGNIGRYVNHSCDPNCNIVPVRSGSPIPKLCLFACKDISPDEEITFHFGLDDETVNESDRIKCLCGAQNCRGFIPYHKY
ncbi:probable histone-lysine N-methyltransferase set-23 [Spodoptera litura]|uniref:Probable histone-lysine N-methyltransferase set-23 n=1 Tax=Spodoptera litura TaxID=69820 RepID=A0A9J7E8V6_SPOLT|nr:probable histone-lysine N-methyltransferase set-23 [Spodoptera litura]